MSADVGLEKKITIQNHVVTSILTYAQMAYPQEGILLLRGKTKKDKIVIENVVIPPAADHGNDFSSFPVFMLPMDYSIIGVAHSHPSGSNLPSDEDLNNFYGKLMAIVKFPFRSEKDIAIYGREGVTLPFDVVDDTT